MEAGYPHGTWDFARRRTELAELIAAGLSRWQQHQARLAVKSPVEVTSANVFSGLDVVAETVLTVTPGLQSESPNPRSTKWKRC